MNFCDSYRYCRIECLVLHTLILKLRWWSVNSFNFVSKHLILIPDCIGSSFKTSLLWVSLYACMFACVHVCMYVCRVYNVCMHVCARVCVDVCMDVCARVRVCMYVCTCMCVCVFVCVRVRLCVYVYLYVCMYMCIYCSVYTWVWVCVYACMIVWMRVFGCVCMFASAYGYVCLLRVSMHTRPTTSERHWRYFCRRRDSWIHAPDEGPDHRVAVARQLLETDGSRRRPLTSACRRRHIRARINTHHQIQYSQKIILYRWAA